ncbi:DUF5914 domain-containing protein [Propionibacteriaceae bacterium Y1685]|uniref:DUF5914 domain-containing protein n=1 Tax=Microlunatus sp. Y1700 TaxID=3418487 RepID=UPI003B79A0FD
MSELTRRMGEVLRRRVPLQVLPQPDQTELRSTWRAARPARIEESLRLAQEHEPGGWCVVGASGDVRPGRSRVRTVAGREVVLWRDTDGSLLAGPGACPHMGARLDDCVVSGRTVLCRWHGMAVGPDGEVPWQGFPAHDDGVLLWVRLPVPGEEPTEAPRITERPPLAESVSAVLARRGICEPSDVIANRLDPWHGAWFHPYAFSHLDVDEGASSPERLVVDVAFRLNRSIGVAVRAEFTCPDARTIVMTITDGEGAGSVVETHATPLTGPSAQGPAATMVVEATIAYSTRPGFAVARLAAPLLRPAMRRTAATLWVDDLAYAERRYALRND